MLPTSQLRAKEDVAWPVISPTEEEGKCVSEHLASQLWETLPKWLISQTIQSTESQATWVRVEKRQGERQIELLEDMKGMHLPIAPEACLWASVNTSPTAPPIGHGHLSTLHASPTHTAPCYSKLLRCDPHSNKCGRWQMASEHEQKVSQVCGPGRDNKLKL